MGRKWLILFPPPSRGGAGGGGWRRGLGAGSRLRSLNTSSVSCLPRMAWAPQETAGISAGEGAPGQRRGEDHHPVLGRPRHLLAELLQAAGGVHGVADGGVVHPAGRADVADHRGTRVQADAQADGRPAGGGGGRVVGVDGAGDGQGRPAGRRRVTAWCSSGALQKAISPSPMNLSMVPDFRLHAMGRGWRNAGRADRLPAAPASPRRRW